MRGAGILLPVSSLPSNYGIGALGKSAYNFVDFLEKSGQKFWQILPMGQTSYGDSPYQSFSTFAGNPYFIDLDVLISEGLLEKADVEDIKWEYIPEKVEYAILYENRYVVLKKAFENFKKEACEDFETFKTLNADWLYDFALFMSIKAKNDDVCWLEWDENEKLRDEATMEKLGVELKDEIEFRQFIQYKFFEQWNKLKEYANKKGIKIVGDIPIYVALDSADVWTNRDEYDLDDNGYPNTVAGCPPDAFSDDGQLWGNPIYAWDKMAKSGFKWWIKRIKSANEMYDITRIDHFRGFDEYYSIPFGEETARNGEWVKGPGYSLFEVLKKELGNIDIIAEDLGFLTDSVRKMLKKCKYPGMKILQFGFNPEHADGEYLPHNYPKNCIAYTGTHDNSTTVGWHALQNRKTKKHIANYLDIKSSKQTTSKMIKVLFACVADTVIIPIQDYLELDDSARINIPSTLGGNWEWRATDEQISNELADYIKQLTEKYYRI